VARHKWRTELRRYNSQVKAARLKGRRPLQIQRQIQMRPAKAGRYNGQVNGKSSEWKWCSGFYE
jgi:hypothetical protein